MSKLAKLITKVEVFEKIAAFGSIKAVLNKLAQTPNEGTALESYKKLEAGGRSVAQALQELHQRTNSPTVLQHMRRLERDLPAPGQIDINSAKVIMDTVKDIEMALAQEDYKTFQPTIREISSIFRQMEQNYKTINWVASQAAPRAPAGGELDFKDEVDPTPQAKPKTMVPEGIQGALTYLGAGPLVQDNILGKATQTALNWFKDTFKIPFNGDALYKAVMSEYQDKRINREDPDLTDAAKSREKFENSQIGKV